MTPSAQPQSRNPPRGGEPAARHLLVALPVRAAGVSRQGPRSRRRRSAGRAAAGRDRICAASAPGAAWPDRPMALPCVRGDAGVPLDRRGDRGRGHRLPPHGSRHPPVVRDDRPTASSARRGPWVAGSARSARSPCRWRCLAFSRHRPGLRKSLGQFGATITLVSNIPGETQTLSLAIFSYLQVPGGDQPAIRLAVPSVALSLLALIASEVLSRRAADRTREDQDHCTGVLARVANLSAGAPGLRCAAYRGR